MKPTCRRLILPRKAGFFYFSTVSAGPAAGTVPSHYASRKREKTLPKCPNRHSDTWYSLSFHGSHVGNWADCGSCGLTRGIEDWNSRGLLVLDSYGRYSC